MMDDVSLLVSLAALFLVAVIFLWSRRRRLLAEQQKLVQQAQEMSGRRRAAAASPTSEPETVPLLPEPTVPPPAPRQADGSRLPNSLPWVGRQKALSQLALWLADPQVAVVRLLAPAGGGKSRLLQHWGEQMTTTHALTVRHCQQSESLSELLSTLAQQPAVFLMDEADGMIATQAEGGDWQNRLLVLSVSQTKEDAVPVLTLEPFRENEAMQLLHELGVRGKFADLRPLVKGLRGHPLLLTLFARMISVYYQGNLANSAQLAPLWEAAPPEQQLQRLLQHYASAIWPAPASHWPLLQTLARQEAGAVPDAESPESVELQQAGWLQPHSSALHPWVRHHLRE
ncbi:MAG: hypothetical protein HQM04_08045 [Magnetococcales bacterium]|nr:hypothetical protein [Magnetococcales bacterium]MBF0114981.1 hypothetical protein [Magnetococcales bacterium]